MNKNEKKHKHEEFAEEINFHRSRNREEFAEEQNFTGDQNN
ncbi:hypothetical protein ACIQ34_04260 [Ureibacillus sp. NPDC094379]